MVATKETRRVGRARQHHPDPKSPNGQIALWIRYCMPDDDTGTQLAAACKVHETTGFRWLSGQAVIGTENWPAIAAYLGFDHWDDVAPPQAFCAFVAKHGRLPENDRELKRG